MIKNIAVGIGFLAAALFIFSYQVKKRRGIILVNATSRVLYVVQYILLGAVAGAVLDVTAFFVSLWCARREHGLTAKHPTLAMIVSNLVVVGVGLLSYQNIYSLIAILGVVFETSALWLKQEKHIRLLSLLGAPCWLVYNLVFSAYGSMLGNVITIVSIASAIVRYDVLKKKPLSENNVSGDTYMQI